MIRRIQGIMERKYWYVYLGLYSAFWGVFFTGALVFGHELTFTGEVLAKFYVLTTGPIWLVAHFKWPLCDND